MPTPDQEEPFTTYASQLSEDGASTFVTRKAQAFPVLTEAEIHRMHRFGKVLHFKDKERLFEAGQVSLGLHVVLKGSVVISRYDGLGNTSFITEHFPGEIGGEVGQLSGRPSFVNGHAVGDVDALIISTEGLRSLLMAEAELGEKIVRALILRRVGLIEVNQGGPVLIAPLGNGALHDLQTWLRSNGHPHTVLDPERDSQAIELVELHQPAANEWPLVICPDGSVRKHPTLTELGRCLGLLPTLSDHTVWDIIIVGAGPAGLAASVYAASEGLSVLILETRAYGGQAASSARIENYLGFPTGISGAALAARAYVQSQKFGVEIAVPAPAGRLHCDQYPIQVEMCGTRQLLQARSVVLACGAKYRRPNLENYKMFEGRGLYYWASPIEARLCKGQEVLVVGGGNSAGQAAVFLSCFASHVHIIVRRKDLSSTMSSYLIERIMATANITVRGASEIVQLSGTEDDGLQTVFVKSHASAYPVCYEAKHVFMFIGAVPNTGWMNDCGVDVDSHGFVLTGQTKEHAALETSIPGVFAIGDVRAGSTKRVAAAVGEGAAVVAQIHGHLAQRAETQLDQQNNPTLDYQKL